MADGTLAITFNGEIYNYRELRNSLERLGHRFVTNSDTEVILKSYREYGERCPEHLDGMFAFALWDNKTKKTGFKICEVGVSWENDADTKVSLKKDMLQSLVDLFKIRFTHY